MNTDTDVLPTPDASERIALTSEGSARGSVIACLAWAYVLAVLVYWLVLIRIGDRTWLGALLLVIPRWPLALPLVGLWPYAAGTRRGRLCGGLALATGVVLIPIMGLRLSTAPADTAGAAIRVVTCNVHRQQLNAGAFAAYLESTRPDVVALQGWIGTHYDLLFGGGEWHVRADEELLVASRFPIVRVATISLGETGRTRRGERGYAARFDLTTPRGMVALINVHLASPHVGLLSVFKDGGQVLTANLARRWAESAALRKAVRRIPNPVILAGDFNTTADSPIFREHWADFSDAFSERGRGFGYTYFNGRTQLRIDHVMAPRLMHIVECVVGPDVRSPHRPLLAKIACP